MTCCATCMALLKALADLNAIDEETEKSAEQYFDLQDKGWETPAAPEPNRSSLTALRWFICSMQVCCRRSFGRFRPSTFMFRRKMKRISLSNTTRTFPRC